MVPPGAGAGDVGVVVMDSNGRRDTVEIVLENKGDSVFRCTYIPVLQGAHTVYVTFAGQQIPRSPFTVHISEGWFGPFPVFLVPQSKVSVNVTVQYDRQNFLQVLYSRSGPDRSSVPLKVLLRFLGFLGFLRFLWFLRPLDSSGSSVSSGSSGSWCSSGPQAEAASGQTLDDPRVCSSWISVWGRSLVPGLQM